MSSFLMYRRVVSQDISFPNFLPPLTIPLSWKKLEIFDSFQLMEHLRKVVYNATSDGKAALALSGGIDSAILAKFMPYGSTVYTFKCVWDGGNTIDETEVAAIYAKECGLNHKIIEITWDDMVTLSPVLMEHKRAPLHSIEVQIYKAGLQAKEDGFTKMIYGESADVNYGGLSNILSRDWRVGDFIERYAYLKPWKVLKNPKVDFSPVLAYEQNGFVDVHRYLSEFDIIESMNSYVNACQTAGIEFVAPYSDTHLAIPLDYNRVRKGENKYMIREIFHRLYPSLDIPSKIPMPRPTDLWLKNWKGPNRLEFLPNCVEHLTGDEKWLCWILESFLNMADSI